VTPGFAKPRSELPWLPYGETDRVIINSHNFISALNFSVNGKTPVSVWCPSRDTAGNGTTTLTDLVGSNNGTLTNFALTGSTSNWVADTNAGGIRAIAADGSNDFVSASAVTFASATWSLWLLHNGSNNSADIWSNRVGGTAGTVPGFVVGANGTSDGQWFFFVDTGSSYRAYQTSTRTSLFANNTWTHLMMTYNASTGAMTIFVNGTNVTSSLNILGSGATGTVSSSSALIFFARPSLTGRNLGGRGDDFRLFNQVLDSTDAAYLYNSGSGRGRTS
jgi:hypothetical protein